jgi:hypothetical protein
LVRLFYLSATQAKIRLFHLTIPQLAEMLRAQFSRPRAAAAGRTDGTTTVRPSAQRSSSPSVADDFTEAFIELKQYQRGEIKLQTLDEFLRMTMSYSIQLLAKSQARNSRSSINTLR